MKLDKHIEKIRQIIENAFINQLGRMGITDKNTIPIDKIPEEYVQKRTRIESVLNAAIAETNSTKEGFKKLVEELTFTLFNRIAALKVMEAHILIPEVITRRTEHGNRSFAHSAWLEQHPEKREEENEGLLQFFEDQLKELSSDIPLFSPNYPYHLLPTSIELGKIIDAFNEVEKDPDIQDDIWKSDDILGWLYESYNNYKKAEHKASGGKTEHNKVSIQSQVYTPRWVVKFLVDNSLGKLYLEMFPDSEIKEKYKIANAPEKQVREPKPISEIRIVDPATGSGNFLLYAFDLLYDMYIDQIENYDADYDEDEIPKLIIENNLYGVDIDDRAVQLAQLGLYIKAKRKRRNIKITQFNIVSADFFLPPYEQVKHFFENGERLTPTYKKIIIEIWEDLQQAYKFGSLIRLQEKFDFLLNKLSKHKADDLFEEQSLKDDEEFRKTFFANLKQAVEHNKETSGQTFLNTKTADAFTFLELLTQKYDIAVANPPYTDSSDYGPELKKFMEENYKRPYKFHSNLYAAFIKRCYELADKDGKLALVHPLTFMYIKTFEDVRKFILNNTHINIMVEAGMGGIFPPHIFVDPVFYILEKGLSSSDSLFISLDEYSNTYLQSKKREFMWQAISDHIASKPNKHNYTLPQEKLKIIDGWPFIYWISDSFREKFRKSLISKIADVRAGIQTSNNKFLRYWWEIEVKNILKNENDYKWVMYSKGGPFNKWYGNLWLVIDWDNEGDKLQTYLLERGQDLHAQEYYFKEGLTYSASGSKGISLRYLPKNHLFDIGGSSIFLTKKFDNLHYLDALLNSQIAFYIIDSLNPTVNKQPGDLKRIPFVIPDQQTEQIVSSLAKENVEIKKQLCEYSIIEINFKQNPLTAFAGNTLKERALAYLNYENYKLTKVLVNEAIIDEFIYKVYELTPEDREQVEAKMGKAIGSLAVEKEALTEFRNKIENENSETKEIVLKHLDSLEVSQFDETRKKGIIGNFETLYQSNNNLEEFCKRHKVNPINIWYWFGKANILPEGRGKEIALEFLADTIRTLLYEDEDGIIPLVGLPGENALLQRLEQYCIEHGFTQAQFMQMDSLLGRPLNDYLEYHFFEDLSNRLNVFRYLPKTPFIWHLSSGKYQGIELYTLIYKWNRDSLYKLKSKYIHDRKNSLQYRLAQLQDVNTAQAQNEKELIQNQLDEIEEFVKKIDELIAEGYDPKLDSGVGKNIAPLQKKGMLKAEVLKSGGRNSQLEKYLKADW